MYRPPNPKKMAYLFQSPHIGFDESMRDSKIVGDKLVFGGTFFTLEGKGGSAEAADVIHEMVHFVDFPEQKLQYLDRGYEYIFDQVGTPKVVKNTKIVECEMRIFSFQANLVEWLEVARVADDTFDRVFFTIPGNEHLYGKYGVQSKEDVITHIRAEMKCLMAANTVEVFLGRWFDRVALLERLFFSGERGGEVVEGRAAGLVSVCHH